MSPYIAFVKKERVILHKEMPHLNFTESMKFLGDKWRTMSKKEKEPFVEIAERDARRFEFEMKH